MRRVMTMAAVVALIGAYASPAVSAELEAPEAPESAVSSPPMGLDDPATPGPQGIELNIVGGLERAGQGRGTESLFDLNYGIGDRLQLKYERPYVTMGEARHSSQQGMGATTVGVKWRFLDDNGWQMAAYPSYTLDDAFTVKDEEGNPEASEGRSFLLPLLISKSVARFYTLAANYGYRNNTDHSTSSHVAGFGLGRAVGANARIMGEVISERDEAFKNLQTDLRVGVASLLFSKTGFEFPGYFAIGRSVGGPEGTDPITSITFGISIVKAAKGE